MPLDPPCTRNDSPARSRPRSNTFVQTVKNVSGIAAGRHEIEPLRNAAGTARPAQRSTPRSRRPTPARTPHRPHASARRPARTPRSCPRPRGRECRWPRRRRIFAFALHQVGPIDAGRGHTNQYLARPGAAISDLDRLQDFRPPGFAMAMAIMVVCRLVPFCRIVGIRYS